MHLVYLWIGIDPHIHLSFLLLKTFMSQDDYLKHALKIATACPSSTS
jgi:hypothetical protein